MTALSGLAGQIGLQLLSLAFAAWSGRTGKLAIAAVAVAGAVWLAADLTLDRAYERGAAEAQTKQQTARQGAIAAARAEGEARGEDMKRDGVAEQAALRELEARKLKVRNETQIADRVLVPADDPWLRAKRR